ncbi:MAG: IS200/IS605 family element transposase accessory protein TnpB [Moorea sp. SIO1F2]|uniref:IS200/IS605 family element RNA-guided endonuclease TnpB n=1 Tax=unclassified Moorena TaxID=2683338 RepID=UPI0013B601DD|nr:MULTISPECIES: IS200/IS605 family element RNA-guided endonuclease TnpB [unclassified Moorena]NEN95470.1 IS200/IS605 family element transposase accessory protein TnpB [Moorena sp. SIO3I7]NEO06472.1 IS200/IS605 family element transposase accessory protein TnpB [Moorena sp. SIO3I8]NEO23166.1 IS200/IS605 family element transposase accessory protein TnpB [Moorena sp. SIO4A5]NEP23254.1 IS200/IS605 family element transposase accessory protein TnpB [Moorena sp. SIO3I6]NEQ59519.1 IS200/IS605 family e
MLKAYKFRLYPDNSQHIALARSFGCARWFWNYALTLCQQTYQDTGKSLSRAAIQGLLPGLKKEYEWLKDCYSQCLQFVANNLSTAFKNFFDKRAKYPRFKSKKGRQTVTYPQHFHIEGDYLKLPGKVGKVYCRQHRPIEGELRSVTVSMNPDGKYFASILVEDGIEPQQPNSLGLAIGIDLGLTHFAVTSEGEKYDNPRHIAQHAKNLKRKQQSLSRKQKGSKNRNKARIKVAKVQGFIARCREDFLHKLSRKIVNENQVIVVENLNVKGMVKNPNLAKAISDCGWGMFTTMLTYKAEWAGKIYVEIDRWFPSSKLCHVCDHQQVEMDLSVRNWTCPFCGTHHDRDINAAINIRNQGLRILELGTSSTALGGDVRQPGKTSVVSDAVPHELGSPRLRAACRG